MVTNISIANELGSISAAVDGNFVTQNNALIVGGSVTGSAALNAGGSSYTIDAFAAQGTVALDVANNRVFADDGAYLTFVQNSVGAGIMIRSLGNTSGTIGISDAGLSFTPDAGDGAIGIAVARGDATVNLALNGTGKITLGGNLTNPVLTIPKDFSLDFNATTYSGTPISGTIYGDGVNDVTASLVNGTQIQLTGNGSIGVNLNLNGTEFNGVTMSGTVVFDPINSAVTLAQGSSLSLNQDGRQTTFTTTGAAGGTFAFGTNGVTFTTAGDDGGLLWSNTEHGATDSATLNLTGSMTYAPDGTVTLAQGTTFVNTFDNGSIFSITANTTDGGTVRTLEGKGIQLTSTGLEANTASLVTSDFSLSNIKLAGTALVSAIDPRVSPFGQVVLSEGSVFSYETASGNLASFIASGSDATLKLGIMPQTFSTEGQLTVALNDTNYIINHGSVTSSPLTTVAQLSAGTDFATPITTTVQLAEVGAYAVNGTLILNNVAGSTLEVNTDGSVVYGTTAYAAGELTIDASGNGIGTVIATASADLAWDFQPNYAEEYSKALALNDTVAFDSLDTQLSELIPAETPKLGKIEFGTLPAQLVQQQQIIIAATEK